MFNKLPNRFLSTPRMERHGSGTPALFLRSGNQTPTGFPTNAQVDRQVKTSTFEFCLHLACGSKFYTALPWMAHRGSLEHVFIFIHTNI
jgi:hypothetical protein